MEKKDLKKLTKGQLIKLLLKKVSNHEDLLDNDPFKDEVAQEPAKRIKPTPPPRTGKWESVPCKSVNEDLILTPPDGYKPIPKPRNDSPLKMQNAPSSINKTTSLIYKKAFFNGKAKTITKPNDIEPKLNISRQEILNMIAQWVSEGLGWAIDHIDSHYINVTLYKPLNGSSYMELPMELRNPKKGLINIKNKDDECFRWCHIKHSNPQTEHPERIIKEDKQCIEGLNYEGIEFPVSQKHYNRVEKQNSIRINVFGYEHGQPFPIHISKETFEDQMNLLLITKDEKKHYVLIKDFNAFMYNQLKHKKRKHCCMYCLQCFSSERVLANHVNNCLTIKGAQAINMPKQGENILKFNNFHKQLPVPFVICADFEAITKKVQGCEQSEEMKEDKDRRSYAKAYQTHEDCGYEYKVICCYDDKYSKYTCIYRGENTVYKFMEKMLEEVEYCKAVIKKHLTNHWL